MEDLEGQARYGSDRRHRGVHRWSSPTRKLCRITRHRTSQTKPT